jgi:transcriptional regulator with XRE-family HTH domain
VANKLEGRPAVVGVKEEGVHNFVREWRVHRDLTQQALAAKIGVSHVAISLLETGRNGYTQAILEKIAEVLDCTPVDLISVDPFLPPPEPPPIPEDEQLLHSLADRDRRLATALMKAIKETDNEQG